MEPNNDLPSPKYITNEKETLRLLNRFQVLARVSLLAPIAATIIGFWVYQIITDIDFPISFRLFFLVVFLVAGLITLPAQQVEKQLSSNRAEYGNVDELQVANWSDKKWQLIYKSFQEAGMPPEKVPVYSVWSDDWNIRVFLRPKVPSWVRYVVLACALPIVFVGIYYAMAEALSGGKNAFNGVLLTFGGSFTCGVAYTLIGPLASLWSPKLGIIVSTGTLRAIRKEPELASAVFAHELSHIRHRDPVARYLWGHYSLYAMIVGPLTVINFIWNFFHLDGISPNVYLLGFISVIAAVCLVFGTKYCASLLPIIQELRADMEAAHNPVHRQALLTLLKQSSAKSKPEQCRIEMLETGKCAYLSTSRMAQSWALIMLAVFLGLPMVWLAKIVFGS